MGPGQRENGSGVFKINLFGLLILLLLLFKNIVFFSFKFGERKLIEFHGF